MSRHRFRRTGVSLVAVGLLAAAATGTAEARKGGEPAPPATTKFELTLLHNNDGESQLINAPGQPNYGGVARFKTLVDQLRSEALTVAPGAERGIKRAALMISSGDNFLAGPRFAASLEKGVPFYDSIALSAVGYDAMVVGNHEFDFGPDVFADFIEGFEGSTTFISSNLDVSAEPRLAALRDAGILASSRVLEVRGEEIGIVAATTPRLSFISSPRNVVVDEDVAGVVQAEVDRLTSRGVDIIIFASHLQSILEDEALLAMLDDVDIAIAGGGDELLANPGDLLVPGDVVNIPNYPVIVQDMDGTNVPVVTTSGDYKYVGQLVATFDQFGNLLEVDQERSGPKRVSGVAPDAVAPDPFVQSNVVDPVAAYQAALAGNVLAQSEVALDGRRSPGVRTMETNLGNLMADAQLEAARSRAATFGLPVPQLAFQNGGGIRNNNIIPAGPLTELNTFEIAAFSNFVSIMPNVSRDTILAVLEHAVSGAPAAEGRFAQVGGMSFVYDSSRAPGDRVRYAQLDDGTVLVDNYAVVAGPAVTIATIDFLARGGDAYPIAGLPFTTLGITYQQALADYLTDTLGGVVSAADYPEGGEGRIVDEAP